jgi:hypothetical protein
MTDRAGVQQRMTPNCPTTIGTPPDIEWRKMPPSAMVGAAIALIVAARRPLLSDCGGTNNNGGQGFSRLEKLTCSSHLGVDRRRCSTKRSAGCWGLPGVHPRRRSASARQPLLLELDYRMGSQVKPDSLRIISASRGLLLVTYDSAGLVLI